MTQLQQVPCVVNVGRGAGFELEPKHLPCTQLDDEIFLPTPRVHAQVVQRCAWVQQAKLCAIQQSMLGKPTPPVTVWCLQAPCEDRHV